MCNYNNNQHSKVEKVCTQDTKYNYFVYSKIVWRMNNWNLTFYVTQGCEELSLSWFNQPVVCEYYKLIIELLAHWLE